MIRGLAVLAVTLLLSGCCTVAHFFCPCDPGEPCRSAGIRETPDAAVDFLVESFLNRRKIDVHTSLHPDFVKENGGFTQEEFLLAYEKFEADFRADAENLAAAARSEPVRDGAAGTVEIVLRNAAAGAEFPIVLKDRPKILVVTTDPFLPVIEGPIEFSSLVRLENGRLSLPADFPLTSIANVQPETVAPLTSDRVVRVEITHDWLVWRIDPARSKNIRFLDKLKEYTAK